MFMALKSWYNLPSRCTNFTTRNSNLHFSVRFLTMCPTEVPLYSGRPCTQDVKLLSSNGTWLCAQKIFIVSRSIKRSTSCLKFRTFSTRLNLHYENYGEKKRRSAVRSRLTGDPVCGVWCVCVCGVCGVWCVCGVVCVCVCVCGVCVCVECVCVCWCVVCLCGCVCGVWCVCVCIGYR